MNAQEAGHRIIRQAGRPLSSKEIARRALSQGLLQSNARSPIDSIAQTIEKNIRDKIYNRPELEFVRSTEGRLIGIAVGRGKKAEDQHEATTANGRRPSGRPGVIPADETWLVALPARLVNKLDLCVMIGLGSSREAVAADMLRRGLDGAAETIMSALREDIRADGREHASEGLQDT